MDWAKYVCLLQGTSYLSLHDSAFSDSSSSYSADESGADSSTESEGHQEERASHVQATTTTSSESNVLSQVQLSVEADVPFCEADI